MKTHKNKVNKAITELKVNEIWNSAKFGKLSQFILSESQKQTAERKLRNELLAVQFQIEDYIEKDQIEKNMRILDFVKIYLRILKISQKELANIFEMKDTNLYKYLIGDRKLNNDLVFKLSSFSHTPPEFWYYIQTKNDLNELRKEKDKIKKYEKYDYVKTVIVKNE
jgi:antitoxin HigA-1